MNYLFVFGTRPEVIKIAPIVFSFRDAGLNFKTLFTAQHQDLGPQALKDIKLTPDYTANYRSEITKHYFQPSIIASSILNLSMHPKPSVVLGVGDTASVLAAAIFAKTVNIPFIHLEAGLRSGSISDPYPEECYRLLISGLAKYHICFSEMACSNLLKEGIDEENIQVSKNPLIDHINMVRQNSSRERLNRVIITFHRNERRMEKTLKLIEILKSLACRNKNISFDIIKHPNWSSDEVSIFGNVCANIKVVNPLKPSEMILQLTQSKCVITDSAGVSEEARILGTPTLVFREHYEVRFDTIVDWVLETEEKNKAINFVQNRIDFPTEIKSPEPNEMVGADIAKKVLSFEER